MTELFTQFGGVGLALLGAAMAAILCGIGSSLGVGMAGQAGAGVATEKPELFGKILLMEALPGTQGIYGFLTAIMVLVFTGFFEGKVDLTISQGWQFFFACLPAGITGLVSAIYQGKVSVAGLNIIAKDQSNAGKAVILSAMVETYAVLGLLVSILLITGIK
jgi:V/A-type H+-transporting ATPase subunit K